MLFPSFFAQNLLHFSFISWFGMIKRKILIEKRKKCYICGNFHLSLHRKNEEEMATMKFYTEEEALDKVLGEKGTSIRDGYEAEMNSFLMGEAIRKARLSKHLTQEQLGDMIGVKRAQVSRIEKGHNLTFATMARVFRSMGIRATLDMGSVGKVALW